MRTVYVVTIEDDSSGAVDWYPLRPDAERKYEGALVEFPNAEINLFALEVEDADSDDTVTDEADTAMWQRDYTPIRWARGADHSATPHVTPPTDREAA